VPRQKQVHCISTSRTSLLCSVYKTSKKLAAILAVAGGPGGLSGQENQEARPRKPPTTHLIDKLYDDQECLAVVWCDFGRETHKKCRSETVLRGLTLYFSRPDLCIASVAHGGSWVSVKEGTQPSIPLPVTRLCFLCPRPCGKGPRCFLTPHTCICMQYKTCLIGKASLHDGQA
jgi:hypothetical protein